MEKIDVSVVVPVYNVEDYLSECLDSILKQTFSNIEVIVVNDGSTDNSQKIIDYYKSIDSRIICITQKNQGAAVARNAGLDIARGTYINFFDSDDIMTADFIEKVYNAAISNSSDAVVCQSFKIFDKDYANKSLISNAFNKNIIKDQKVIYPIKIADSLFQCFVGWAWDKLFLTSFVRSNDLKFQSLRQHNDLFFTYLALSLANKISLIEKPLVIHRYHKNSTEATGFKSPSCFYLALEKLYFYLKKNDLLKHYYKSFFSLSINLGLWFYSLANESKKDECNKLLKDLLSLVNDKSSYLRNPVSAEDKRTVFTFEMLFYESNKYEFVEILKKNNIDNIVFYGFGAYGQFLFNILLNKNIKICYALDQKIKKVNELEIRQIDYCELKNLPESETVIVTVISDCCTIKSTIKENNNCKVFDIDDLIELYFKYHKF